MKTTYLKSVVIFFTLVTILFLCFPFTMYSDKFSMYMQNIKVENESSVEHLTNANGKNYTKDDIVIFFWTKNFGRPPSSPKLNEPCFKGCFVFQVERKILRISDAVIFNSYDLLKNSTDLPKWRDENQLWMFMEFESPMRFDRHDADVYWPYYRILEANKNDASPVNKSLMERKSKLVAWLVSHCDTPSKREQYVSELNQHIQVDIYGKCGNLTCPKNGDCMSYLGSKYKFYLSFENSLCDDYITEKLRNALDHNMLPIVMGGGDYERLAPPKSYINIEDFVSPKELAEYLLFLDKNFDKYMEYFEWRRKYEVEGGSGWCTLCRTLKRHFQNPKKKTYSNLYRWWNFTETGSGNLSDLRPACRSPTYL